MEAFTLSAGTDYLYEGQIVRLLSVEPDLVSGTIQLASTHVIQQVALYRLLPIGEDGNAVPTAAIHDSITTISDESWEKARHRLTVIQPLLAGPSGSKQIKEVATTHKISIATLYRWKNKYLHTNSLSSLLDEPNFGPKGKRRLEPAVEEIIQKALETHFLTKQKMKPQVVITTIQDWCESAGLPVPSGKAIRQRMLDISPEEVVTRRQGQAKAEAQFRLLKSSFPGVNYPLDVVQLDHTLVDVILVDEQFRQPLGRPWLTIATDVFSRMVTGLYLSYEHPGAAGTGICLANAIMPKELLLERLGIQGDWPCWGIMRAIHTDNAKEFVGTTLQRACEQYGIKRLRRIPKKPYLGGHVERLMKTFMQQVHELPGSTFSNTKEKGDYNSLKEAALTLREFEYWFCSFIINIYHRRMHKALGQSPFERYREGLLGSARFPNALGLPPRPTNDKQLRLDFMPAIKRVVSREGVLIGHIHYNADVLRTYITGVDSSLYSSERPKKQLFKLDPRDISVIYFLDPVTKEYLPIPYRNTNNEEMSSWEYKQVLNRLREEGKKQIPEKLIMTTRQQMRDHVAKSITKTKRMKLSKKAHRFIKHPDDTAINSVSIPKDVIAKADDSEQELISSVTNPLDFSSRFNGFSGLDDDAFAS
ncbi:MAG: hypothetical protein EOO61_04250 [Hymenobacter sp.]|nr:MAG: hypothetical protein EOO61_04250 [Hymenobacter sp.]